MTTDTSHELPATGPILTSPSDLLSEAFSAGAHTLVVPTTRLPAEFFQLRTGLAGEIMQKFVNYNRRLIVLGDISSLTAASKPLHDLVYEMNQGTSIWFLATREELEARLAKS